ncbi:hypothetical protein A374_04239 [Fictibacillus macauensis ZFHKF-1]|uniref:N-acetyltransferase domain-containing protein n=1 Tax=Fictibacillus macauensis ZFHKF-1 TaxID=1196324 RepID=I8ALH1_9BACL|nr:hypothetical protein [Fictibacillus macauensis]EIT86752.1 hypothetical protein A374_04239 [Fictibacillus macauensis ZFHKF-1]
MSTMVAERAMNEVSDLEFQVLRMQNDLKEIAKRWDVVGVEQSKDEHLTIVYKQENQHQCKIMLNDCASSFQGTWDYSIDAAFKGEDGIFIGDIRGPANKGYGSICMPYLKEIAREHNIPCITGDIAKRDWDHVDRLVYFYEKHGFIVELDEEKQTGSIVWRN